ncbi:MAG: SPOR domain-containing protein [Candidatus Omnitrophica bacterium]|nr:SPOR domain-containing protein [Candidatus Omnitrophota bacterium]MBI3021991.1 SPOR domain-containing protein [Candidatus Omnitrophota bacterium]MBI3082893.1 SPOR domain-containing protein [Candidatus Omnitrophota bacterium]
MPDTERQLELFDVVGRPGRVARQETVGRFLLHARYDQLVLAGIGSLIGLTVVFACGVERGKQFARAEQALLSHQERTAPPPSMTGAGKPPVANQPLPTVPPEVAGAQKPAPPPAASTPQAPKAKEPSKPAFGKSRYAVQVVTYSRPGLAKQEVQRLKKRGETAFLVMREGRTSVYVGPFPSKRHADRKLTKLKSRYQDCFIRTL